MDDSVATIRAEEEQIGFKMEAHLRGHGWVHTSSTPGYYWMWKREIDGVTYMVERTTAIRIQSWIEAHERHPDGPPSSRRPCNEDG